MLPTARRNAEGSIRGKVFPVPLRQFDFVRLKRLERAQHAIEADPISPDRWQPSAIGSQLVDLENRRCTSVGRHGAPDVAHPGQHGDLNVDLVEVAQEEVARTARIERVRLEQAPHAVGDLL